MKKIWLLLIGFIFIIILVFGVRFLLQQNPTQQYTGIPEKISIGNVREYSIFNSIAKDKGYFAENGLDADVKEYDSGPAAMKDLVAGKVDFALASDNAGVQNIFADPDIRIISQFVRNSVFSVVARKDNGITKPTDLKGKKIGVTKKSAGEFLFSQFLISQNMSQQGIVIVDLTPAQIKTQLENGTIDAGVLFEPSVFDVIKALGNTIVLWPVDRGYYTFGLIYTTNTFIQQHPALVELYLKSLVEAEQYVNTHPTETKDLIAKRYGYSKEYIEYSWPKNQHSIQLDQELLLTMESIAKWVITNKLTDKTTVPDYLDYMYFSSLEKVKPDSVSIIH